LVLYREDNIRKVFDGGILGYEDAPHPHLESFMVGMAYQPNVETAKRQGRPFDIPVGLGTDGTRVSSYNPWFSLYWAVTGKAFGGDQMFSEQNMLSRQKALELMTRGSAYLSSEEYSKGAILPGKFADLAVLSKDYFTVPEEEIRSIQSVLTVVDGKIVYGTEEFAKLSPALPKIVPSWSPVLFYGEKYGCC